MTKKILVPLDGSALAEQALGIAEQMMDSEVDLILLRVGSDLEEAQDYLEERAREYEGKRVQVLVTEGSVAEQIIEVTERTQAGLIIMTTHGAGGLGRWLMGSVAERVVRHAPCPVLTIGRRSLQ